MMDVYRRCMTATPVMKYDQAQGDWVESGIYEFDSKGALKALELLGKNIGMFSTGSAGAEPVTEDDPITRSLKEDQSNGIL